MGFVIFVGEVHGDVGVVPFVGAAWDGRPVGRVIGFVDVDARQVLADGGFIAITGISRFLIFFRPDVVLLSLRRLRTTGRRTRTRRLRGFGRFTGRLAGG